MPYVDQLTRNHLRFTEPRTAGELNYCITLLLKQYWDGHSNYQGINDIMGACQGAALEFYRRVAVDYENIKREANGDVYQ